MGRGAWLLEPGEKAIINDNKVKGTNPVLLLLSSFFGAYNAAGGILVPRPGLNSCSLHWKHRVLPTGLPGKSLLLPVLPLTALMADIMLL